MSEISRTFSESWYRVANIKVSLRANVKVQKQFFRGKKWYILQDSFNNQFFRLTPEAYDFVSRLRPQQTVEEVWQECIEISPDNVPGQEDIVHLLSNLHIGNLLYFASPADNAK
jgi:putative peptide zinc metalloprotease protein